MERANLSREATGSRSVVMVTRGKAVPSRETADPSGRKAKAASPVH